MSLELTPFDVANTPIEPGTTLIEASAGTGKTYCLTGLVLRLLLERRVERVGEILVMTFTNAATAELVERIRRALREAVRVFGGEMDAGAGDALIEELRRRDDGRGLGILRGALRDLDDLEVCTIHGFCRRVLQESAFESAEAFDVDCVENDEPLLQRAAQDFWRRTLYPAGDLAAAVAAQCGWTTDAFVRDYFECRRHPGILLEPTALSFDEAVARLEAAARAVRAAWDVATVPDAIWSLRYVEKKRPSAGAHAAHVAALDAFCRGARAGGVDAVLRTRGEALRGRLTDKGKREFATFPFSQACDDFACAIEELRHALRARFLRDIDASFEREKHVERVAGFDDLLHRLHAALRDPARRERLVQAAGAPFGAVLIDEFQDTDAVQYEIFGELFPRAAMFFIGDPKQAIYAFRGADVFAYMRAKADAARAYTLDRNRRSETPLVEAVNAVFARCERPFVFDAIPFVPVRPAGRADAAPIAGDDRRAMEWMWLGAHESKADGTVAACAAVTAEIVRLLDPAAAVRIGDRRIEPEHIAVLVRTNDQAEQVQSALRAAGVPAVVSQAGNVFETEEARELRTLLLAVATPRDEGAVRAALATNAWGYRAADVAALDRDEHAWQRVVDRLHDLRAVWTRKGFVATAYALLAEIDARRRLLASRDGERSLTNLLHLIELAQQASVEHHLSPDGVLAWLTRAMAAATPTETAELRLESDADAVQIVTIHKSKGLEYDVVFCPFLWHERGAKLDRPLLLHPYRGGTVYHCAKPPAPDRVVEHAAEQLAENVRLAYVALTRAKHRCYVGWGVIGDARSRTALAHVLHGPRVAGATAAHDWREDLAQFCARNAERMSLRDAAAPVQSSLRRPPPDVRPLAARELPRRAHAQLVPWRVASFTSFRVPIAEADAYGPATPHDAAAAGAASAASAARAPRGATRRDPAAAATPIAPPAVEVPDYGDPSSAPVEERAAGGMFAFARGPRAGTCLHEILEHTDFADVSDAGTAERVTAALRRHGLAAPEAHDGAVDAQRAVLGALRDLAASSPPHAGFRLADVTRAARIDEWQFYLPMARVSQAALAECFARHGTGWIAREYPALLRALGDRAVEGFLTGFVDMVFTHDARWFVVDWKSNYLGNAADDYDDAAVTRAMRDHHYVLQYHLYGLALHRHLARRLRGYDYERDFGGAYYVFVRAIRPGQAHGWYFDRPPRALIDALDALIAGDVRGRA